MRAFRWAFWRLGWTYWRDQADAMSCSSNTERWTYRRVLLGLWWRTFVTDRRASPVPETGTENGSKSE
jgi:hypothetical protein